MRGLLRRQRCRGGEQGRRRPRLPSHPPGDRLRVFLGLMVLYQKRSRLRPPDQHHRLPLFRRSCPIIGIKFPASKEHSLKLGSFLKLFLQLQEIVEYLGDVAVAHACIQRGLEVRLCAFADLCARAHFFDHLDEVTYVFGRVGDGKT